MNYYIQKYLEYTQSLKMKEGEKVKGKKAKSTKEYQKGVKVSGEIFLLLNKIKNETGIPMKKLIEIAVNEKYGNKGG